MPFHLEAWGQVSQTLLNGVRPFLAVYVGFFLILGLYWGLGKLGVWRGLSWGWRTLDTHVLVGWLSVFTGTRWTSSKRRWGQFLLVSLLVAVGLAAFPLAYVPWILFAGLLVILSVLRDWSRREHDWEEAQNHGPMRDIRFQAVTSAALLFLFVPMGLSRLDDAYHLFPDPRGSLLVDLLRDWLGRAGGFAVSEAPHSVPLVHALWPDGNPFRDGGREGIEILAAALRLGYELLAVAVFIDVLRIAQRMAAQKDLRNYRAALDTGRLEEQLAAVDALAELAGKRRRDATDLLIEATNPRSESGALRSPAVRSAAAWVLLKTAERFNWRGELFVALERIQELVRTLRREDDPLDWAQSLNNLGVALWNLGDQEISDTAKVYLLKSIDALEMALTVYTKDEYSLDWAIVQNNISNSYKSLGEICDQASNKTYLLKAVEVAEAALTVGTRETSPDTWAISQNNLGNALQRLGEMEPGEVGKAYLMRAIQAYEATFEVYTGKSRANDWAGSQNNLAIVYVSLANKADGDEAKANMRRGIAAYEAALSVYAPDTDPANWAMAQRNIGLVLQKLGILEGGEVGTAYLLRAVNAHKSASQVRTRGAAPFLWALTQRDIAYAYHDLSAIAEGDAEKDYLEKAIDAYQSAAEIYSRGAAPSDWAGIKYYLGMLLRRLGDLDSDKAGQANLLKAVDSYEEATLVYTRNDAPIDWAACKFNSGIALESLGDRDEGEAQTQAKTGYYQRAIEAYEAALEGYDAAGDQDRSGYARGRIAKLKQRLNPDRDVPPSAGD